MCLWAIAFICFDFLPMIVHCSRYPSVFEALICFGSQIFHVIQLWKATNLVHKFQKIDSSLSRRIVRSIDRSIEQLFRFISIHYIIIYSHNDCAIINVNCDECQILV